MALEPKRDVERAADVIRIAGGRVVGRTRLQKIAYILEIAGLGGGFLFDYRRFGPYSEPLTVAMRGAKLLGLVEEEEHVAAWGGTYSIFSANVDDFEADPVGQALVHELVDCDAVELELAATAAFLSLEGQEDPWGETARRKPEKADGGRLENAKSLYQRLSQFDTPKKLPNLR